MADYVADISVVNETEGTGVSFEFTVIELLWK